MDSIVTRCDICSAEMDKNEKRHLSAILPSGRKEDGIHPIIFTWKDICDDCSFILVKTLEMFKERRLDSE